VLDRQRKVLELLDASGARLHALLARLTLSEDTVGDLMQELCLRLCKSRGLDRARDPFAYAYRAAINLALEWRRKQKLRFDSLDEHCLPPRDNPVPLGRMIQAEQLQQVLDATSRLSRLAREVVVMRYIEQESYEQIGQRLGRNPQHLRAVCAKALARLREFVAADKSRPTK
jgi:RNA polymerase sigma factor (sigma-70 family)